MVLKTLADSDSTDLHELASIKLKVESRLADLLPPADSSGQGVASAMRSCVLAPGKRLRPLLLILMAKDLGCETGAVVDVACAIEMVHAASLILDDMPCMDNAKMRRGQPAVHVAFGEDVAILAAVALLSHAFKIVASAPGVPPTLRARLAVDLSTAVGLQGLVMGQYEDLREGALPRSTEQIANTNALKTSKLFRIAMDMAAALADADDRVRAGLGEFADELGQAYQLLDDLKDYGDATAVGKDVLKDVGKSTLIGVLGMPAARTRLLLHVQRAQVCLETACGNEQGTQTLLKAVFPTYAFLTAPDVVRRLDASNQYRVASA